MTKVTRTFLPFGVASGANLRHAARTESEVKDAIVSTEFCRGYLKDTPRLNFLSRQKRKLQMINGRVLDRVAYNLAEVLTHGNSYLFGFFLA